MKFDNLLLDIEDRIATITINRPEVRNALDGKTWGEISEALDALEGDAEVGAIIITGAGEKSFAAGADIRQLNTRTLLDGLNAPTQKSLIRLEAVEKPVIAAINGFALGGSSSKSPS